MSLVKLVQKVLLYAYIFYVIYTPIFGSGIIFDKYVVLYILMFIMLAPYILKRDNSLLHVLGKKSVIFLMLFVLLSSIYFTVIQIINNVDINGFMDLRLVQNNIINVLIIHAAIIIDKLKKRGYTNRQSFELLLKIGAIQGIICLLGLFAPLFKDAAVFFYTAAGGSNPFVIDARIFGISSDYTFGTPIYHGILAGVAVYLSIKERLYKYYYYIPLILAATFLNGRTGIIVFIIIALSSILYLYLRKGNVLKAASTITALAIGLLLSLSLLQNLAPNSYKFVNSFIDDTTNLLLEGDLTGNYSVLAETNSYPSDVQFFFGEGYRVYDNNEENKAGFRSDIGYVNDMYMGGLFFVIILYLSAFYFLLSGVRGNRFIFFIIIIALLVANFKGEIFRSSIVMFLIVYLKLLSIQEEQI